jgi:hypothetical protein
MYMSMSMYMSLLKNPQASDCERVMVWYSGWYGMVVSVVVSMVVSVVVSMEVSMV